VAGAEVGEVDRAFRRLVAVGNIGKKGKQQARAEGSNLDYGLIVRDTHSVVEV
jgi:hypothetical protein